MYHNIMIYQVMTDILKKWLDDKIISQKDFQIMHTKMADKYGISLSGIFVDNSSLKS